jgi:hypothetical protein
MMAEGMFKGFLEKAKTQSDCERLANQPDDGTFRHLQVRLTSRDAKRVRCQADERNLSIQDALVTALNNLMLEWGQQPVANPGTAKRKRD